MSRFEVEQLPRQHLRVADLHPHLMCVLCGGYYVDATTIIECLHSFCKSCLVRYLESNKYCPICEVQVHKTKPLLNIRPDETLQNMVYKLVPGLFYREMKNRQEFYAKHPDAPPSSLEDRGVVDPIECQFYSPEELVSLALEFNSDGTCSSSSNGAYKRFLRCPAAVTVAHLQKLVRNKYDLPPLCQVEVMFEEKLLTPDYSIMDVAYTFQRKRKEQFHFTYRIVERPCKKRKLEESIEREKTVEQMEVGPPTLQSVTSAQPVKTTGTSSSESKSKLDSIISRLGIAKQTESVKKGKGSAEWKEVQLQISESGVMSVTDISSIDKLINTIEKNIGPLAPQETKAVPKINPVKEEKIVPTEPKDSHGAKQDQASSLQVKDLRSTLKAHQPEQDCKLSKSKEETPCIKPSELKTEAKQKDELSTKKRISISAPNLPTSASSVPVTACSASQNIPDQKGTAPLESASSASSNSQTCAALTTSTTSVPVKVATTASCASAPPCSSTSSAASQAQSGLSINKSLNAALTTTTTVRAAPVPVTKQVSTPPNAKKSSSSPVGYKTLKCGPKNWNPTISRSSFLSSKVEQQPQQQGSSTGSSSSSSSSSKPTTSPRFFKMRNTPRYLGNPASGVKAMYQVPDSKPETPPPAKSPSVMKLDPRTLTPIVSNASSPTSKPIQVQPKGRPPFPSTTLSAQVNNNHLPSSRSVATTTSSSSAAKHGELSSLRNSPTQPLVGPYLPYLPKGMPSYLFGVSPGLLPTGAQFASMLRPGLGYPQVPASGFHPTHPQSASILFNPLQLHRQLNPSSSSCPTVYPSSLPSSPVMSLSPSSSTSSSSSSSSSKNYTAGLKIPISCEKSLNTSNNSALVNHKTQSNTTLSSSNVESGKVNGSETMKNSSDGQSKSSPLTNQDQRSEMNTKASSAPILKEMKTTSSNASNNNNTLPISRGKSQSDRLCGAKSVLDKLDIHSKESGKCNDSGTAARSKTPSNSSIQTQES